MIMTADFKPASIFNIPSPNERFSLPDEPVTLKSTYPQMQFLIDVLLS